MTRKIGEETHLRQHAKQTLHLRVVNFEDLQNYGTHTCSHKMLSARKQRHCSQKDWENLKSVVEKEVDCLGVKPENQGFKKVDKVVAKFLVSAKFVLHGDQVRKKWTS